MLGDIYYGRKSPKEDVMVRNSVLRQNARMQLGGDIFAKAWLMVMVAYLIYSGIVEAASSVSLGVGAIIVGGPLFYGLCRISVNLVKGKNEINIGELFCGFSEKMGQSILLTLMTGLFTFLWSLLFIVPGIVKAYSYAMAPFLLQDDPEKDWYQCLNESKEMMRGHKWQLFCLDLSFIGWELLGLLCCGVGIIFVYPYQITARANFYLALLAYREFKAREFWSDKDTSAEDF